MLGFKYHLDKKARERKKPVVLQVGNELAGLHIVLVVSVCICLYLVVRSIWLYLFIHICLLVRPPDKEAREREKKTVVLHVGNELAGC